MIKPRCHSWTIYSFIVALALNLPPVTENVASAATYYVATTGNDANPGSATQPFLNIQRAADLVNPGDTVIVRDGTYTDTNADGLVVYVRRGGTSSAWVTFKSENKWGAKLSGAEQGVSIDTVGYVRIEGFEIANMVSATAAHGITGWVSNLQVVNNHIHHIGNVCTDSAYGMTGFYFTGANNVTIEENVIHDIGRLSPGENGCNPATTYYQNHDHGLYFSPASNVLIKNNVFYNNKHGWSIHMYPQAVDNVRIVNNTFAFPNPWRVGHIILSAPISNSLIENNIFYQPTTAALFLDAVTFSNVTTSNNLTYGGTISTSSPSGVVFSGNLNNTDPKFSNVSAYDFHLTAGSPAINAGLTLAEVPIDFDGVTRPQGSAYDIGAYEFSGTPSAPPTGLRVQ